MSTNRCWNRCDRCNRFLPHSDFADGLAERRAMPIFAADIYEYERADRDGDLYWTECIGDKRKACDARAHRLWMQEAYAL